jgi:hypothetical protein
MVDAVTLAFADSEFATRTCVCDDTWWGDQCQYSRCPGGVSGEVACGGHGVCVSNGNPTSPTYSCVCNAGFGGARCTASCAAAAFSVCASTNASCVVSNTCGGSTRGFCDQATQQCVCRDSHFGDVCQHGTASASTYTKRTACVTSPDLGPARSCEEGINVMWPAGMISPSATTPSYLRTYVTAGVLTAQTCTPSPCELSGQMCLPSACTFLTAAAELWYSWFSRATNATSNVLVAETLHLTAPGGACVGEGFSTTVDPQRCTYVSTLGYVDWTGEPQFCTLPKRVTSCAAGIVTSLQQSAQRLLLNSVQPSVAGGGKNVVAYTAHDGSQRQVDLSITGRPCDSPADASLQADALVVLDPWTHTEVAVQIVEFIGNGDPSNRFIITPLTAGQPSGTSVFAASVWLTSAAGEAVRMDLTPELRLQMTTADEPNYPWYDRVESKTANGAVTTATVDTTPGAGDFKWATSVPNTIPCKDFAACVNAAWSHPSYILVHTPGDNIEYEIRFANIDASTGIPTAFSFTNHNNGDPTSSIGYVVWLTAPNGAGVAMSLDAGGRLRFVNLDGAPDSAWFDRTKSKSVDGSVVLFERDGARWRTTTPTCAAANACALAHTPFIVTLNPLVNIEYQVRLVVSPEGVPTAFRFVPIGPGPPEQVATAVFATDAGGNAILMKLDEAGRLTAAPLTMGHRSWFDRVGIRNLAGVSMSVQIDGASWATLPTSCVDKTCAALCPAEVAVTPAATVLKTLAYMGADGATPKFCALDVPTPCSAGIEIMNIAPLVAAPHFYIWEITRTSQAWVLCNDRVRANCVPVADAYPNVFHSWFAQLPNGDLDLDLSHAVVRGLHLARPSPCEGGYDESDTTCDTFDVDLVRYIDWDGNPATCSL